MKRGHAERKLFTSLPRNGRASLPSCVKFLVCGTIVQLGQFVCDFISSDTRQSHQMNLSNRLFLGAAILLGACDSGVSSEKAEAKRASERDTLIAQVCGSPAKPLPYTVLDVGIAAKMSSGREARELIQNEEEWQARWKALADSAPMPKVAFRDSIVLIITSPVSDSSPRSLEFEQLKACVGTQDIVVPVRTHTSNVKTTTPERSLRAIQIARDVWKTRRLTFYDLPPVVDPAPKK